MDVILLLMDEILYMMAQNVHLMVFLLNVAPKLHSGNIWSVYHSRRRKLCIPYITILHTHVSWSSKSNLVVQHDKAHQDKNFKLSYVKFHQKIKKNMNYNIFPSTLYTGIFAGGRRDCGGRRGGRSASQIKYVISYNFCSFFNEI